MSAEPHINVSLPPALTFLKRRGLCAICCAADGPRLLHMLPHLSKRTRSEARCPRLHRSAPPAIAPPPGPSSTTLILPSSLRLFLQLPTQFFTAEPERHDSPRSRDRPSLDSEKEVGLDYTHTAWCSLLSGRPFQSPSGRLPRGLSHCTFPCVEKPDDR